jgi:predicted  nucleic acid-binding Zn-ribbon protein
LNKRIPISKGYFALVNEEDYQCLIQYNWSLSNGYAITTIKDENKNKTISMHRMIMNDPKDKFIDHINGDKLDNRKENLRLATHQQNQMNRAKRKNSRSKFKGIKVKSTGSYEVRITYQGERIYIGTFKTEESGANAYNYYANEYFGEFARLNNVPYMDKEEWEKYRITLKDENSSSSYSGVFWTKDKKKWKSCLTVHIGYFETEEEAALAYNDYIIKNKLNRRLNDVKEV